MAQASPYLAARPPSPVLQAVPTPSSLSWSYIWDLLQPASHTHFIHVSHAYTHTTAIHTHNIHTHTQQPSFHSHTPSQHNTFPMLTHTHSSFHTHTCSHKQNIRPHIHAVTGKVKVTQLCLTLCDPMDCTVQGILQARILEWVAFPFSRGSFQPRDGTQVSCIAGRFFTS